jgi:transposase
VQADLARPDLLPSEHLVDSGYVDAGHLVQSQAQGIDLVGPASSPHDWQTRTGQGFAQGDFTIDWQTRTATCPQGQRSVVWKGPREHKGHRIIRVEFAPATCLACPVRTQCTRATTGPRTLALLPHAEFDALRAARARQQTDDFTQRYARRAGIEGTLSQAVRVFGLRQARYCCGQAKTHLQHLLIAVALNVARLCAWLDGATRAPTRLTPFAALFPQAAEPGAFANSIKIVVMPEAEAVMAEAEP